MRAGSSSSAPKRRRGQLLASASARPWATRTRMCLSFSVSPPGRGPSLTRPPGPPPRAPPPGGPRPRPPCSPRSRW
ncbi:MAG: hypothetical protein ACK56I_09965 [bacterium]